ncbi:hypothetical protein CC1G_11471 [Coprinopsis cinerea okayama7|uniref:Uncharacterized protein n=1 Tax=Coprinopsis cinerea (strain Okayama-7 / 130 / ATCC MYA-4618 / FGSC 9003) TaxID=240176 RepID=A8NMP4_COPC7|nr:hypothetical protein CC1G_11471 [Coprinopsis cinerea okayama7\|eukprot:XP_001834957.1 hypothetical protein CC1G_11471 [Coprinopsis cinerea okayama7\
MATITPSVSAFTNEELREIFRPALQRLRTLLNNYQHWPQDEDWPQKVRRAVMGLVKICNTIPSTCPLYAGHPIKALFDQIRASPELRQPGTPIDPSFLKDVKPDPPTFLDPFDKDHPRAYIDQTLDFITRWRMPPRSSVPPAHQSALPVASSSGKDNERGISTGKGKERENEGGGTVDYDRNSGEGEQEEEEEEEEEEEDEEEEVLEDGNGCGEHQGNQGVAAIRRSPRKRATTSVTPGGGSSSGTGSAFVLCDRCLKAKALAQHSKALGKKFEKGNLDPPCTPPGSGSCPRCANGKKKCERFLNGDAVKALALALKRGRQRKSAVAPDDPSVHLPKSNQEASTAKKSTKRKSAAYIEDSDVDSSAPTAADSENTPAAKKPRMDNAKSAPASEVDRSKAGVKAKQSTKRTGKGSKPTTPVDPVEVTAMPSGPSNIDVVYAGTKQLGPLYHPRSAQPMVFSNPPSMTPPADSTVVPAYQTELPTGNLVADLVSCTSKQDALEGRMNQADSSIRGLTAAVNRLEDTARIPTVRRGELDELRRKITFLEKDFNEREARLEKTTDSTLALVRNWEERMKTYEARMEGIEERMNELTNKVDGVANNSDLQAKVEAMNRTSNNALRQAEELQQEAKRDLKGLYVVEGRVRELMGRVADAERELQALDQWCHGLQGDSDEIWDHLTTSVNQSTLEAVLDRVGGLHGRALVERGTSPTTGSSAAESRPVVSRGTSPLPAPAAPNFTHRATSPIPDRQPHLTRLNIVAASVPLRPLTGTASIHHTAAIMTAPPSASVVGSAPSKSPPVPPPFLPAASGESGETSPDTDDVVPDSPLSPPPDDLEDMQAGTRRKATQVQAKSSGAAATGARRSKRQKKS